MNLNIKQNAVVTPTTLVTGIADMKIVAVNPTEEQLSSLSPNHRWKEPKVDEDNDGNPRVRLDWYYTVAATDDTPEVNGSFSTFITNVQRTNKDNTKVQCINSRGVSCWIEAGDNAVTNACEKYAWFNPEGARIALSGEEQLYGILTSLFNFDNRAEGASLDISSMYKSWFGGQFNFDPIVNHEAAVPVRRLMFVKDNMYQQVWTKAALRPGQIPNYLNDSDRFIKELKGEYGPNGDYQNSLRLQVFSPTLDAPVTAIPETSVTPTDTNPFGLTV